MDNDQNNGQFQKGHPGGPGRPKDSRPKSEKLLDRLANSRGDNLAKIVDGVMALAQSGERWACEALFARLWPAPKGRPIKGLDLPSVSGAAGIAAAYDRLIECVNMGTLSPGEALECAQLLKLQSDALEAKEIDARLSKLEIQKDVMA